MSDDRQRTGESDPEVSGQEAEVRQGGDEKAKGGDGGRKPPPDDLENDPAYEPKGPLKEIKGG